MKWSPSFSLSPRESSGGRSSHRNQDQFSLCEAGRGTQWLEKQYSLVMGDKGGGAGLGSPGELVRTPGLLAESRGSMRAPDKCAPFILLPEASVPSSLAPAWTASCFSLDWSRTALQPMPCSLAWSLTCPGPGEGLASGQPTALQAGGRGMDPSPSLSFFPGSLLSLWMTVLWVPVLIPVQPHLLAPQEGAESAWSKGETFRSEGTASVGRPGELSPGGLGSQGCLLST